MDEEIRCAGCDEPLPWAKSLKVDGALCTACLKYWLRDQRDDRVSA